MFRPSRAAVIAASQPAWPPPTTITSKDSVAECPVAGAPEVDGPVAGRSNAMGRIYRSSRLLTVVWHAQGFRLFRRVAEAYESLRQLGFADVLR